MLDEPTIGLDPLMEQVFRKCILEAKEAGQTVFLSSHILGEVEALCDRVAILRSGGLVESGTIVEMRHLSAITIEATFSSTPPDLSKVPGVKDLKVTGKQLYCQIQGAIKPLLEVIAGAGVINFLSREPSLEELFLALYGEETRSESPGAVHA